MTSAPLSLTPDLLAVVENYRTCEFATLSRSGVPIAWPTVPYRRPDGTFLITTSIALPQKAYNVRRDPRVAMLFSEPTASGLTGAPELLIQGEATCPDEVVTDVEGLEEYWHRLHARQPFNKNYSANPLSRRLFDWYYMRLLVTVRPSAVGCRPPLGPGAAPTSEGAPDGVAGDALRRLATFPSAVLGTRDAEGFPHLRRVRVPGPGGGASLALDVPGDDVLPGPASLLAHVHDEQLWSQRSVVVVGALDRAGDRWSFVPERVIPGTGGANPVAVVRTIRALSRTARGYLEKRSLPRPQVPWDDLHRVTAGGRARRREPGGGPPSSP